VTKVYRERLQDGYAGYTDGFDVFLDDRLNAEQTLCTLQHELIHIERGHKGHQTEDVEMGVRYETARRLLPLDRIVGVCKANKPLRVLAVELGVTRQVLMDRAATLSDQQASDAGCWDCQKCPAIQMRAAMMIAA
jgi:Zn-dependent peptidase ImmA (M78 family)